VSLYVEFVIPLFLLLQVWNISTGEPVLETSLPANGSVQHIEVQDSTVMYSVDEPSLPVASGLPDLIPYGVVHLLNPASGATIVVKVRTSFTI
jgi:hypothetical protein